MSQEDMREPESGRHPSPPKTQEPVISKLLGVICSGGFFNILPKVKDNLLGLLTTTTKKKEANSW